MERILRVFWPQVSRCGRGDWQVQTPVIFEGEILKKYVT